MAFLNLEIARSIAPQLPKPIETIAQRTGKAVRNDRFDRVAIRGEVKGTLEHWNCLI